MQKAASLAVNGSPFRLVAQRAVSVRLARASLPGAVKSVPIQFRSFHVTSNFQTSRDSSTIDYAYMPQHDLAQPAESEITQIPLLPDNFNPNRDSFDHHEPIEAVARPLISTVSADGTHIDSPSAMSDVTDNHAVDFDPFDLTTKVTSAANKVKEKVIQPAKEQGSFGQLWSGFVDDVMGAKKVSPV